MTSAFSKIIQRLTSDQKFSEILTGSAVAMVARALAALLALVTSIIVARLYGAEMTGILAMVNSLLMITTIFTVLGTNTSILRLIPEYTAKYSTTSAFRVYRKTQYLVVGMSIVTGGLLFLSSSLVAGKVFSKPHFSFYIALASGFVVFKSLMDLNTQAVRGIRLIKTFAFMQILPFLVMLLVLIAETVLSPNRNNPVYAQLAAWAVTAVVGAWIVDRAFGKKMHPDDAVQTMSLREILSISLPMLMTASMVFAMGQIGVILLGIFRTEGEVGYYSVAVRLASLTAFFLQAINTIAAPKFSELFHTGKMDELFYVARKSARLIFWATAPILLTLIAFGRQILGLLFGKEFAVAYLAMVFLVLGQFVNSASGSTANFMNMTGHQIIFNKIVLVAAVINVALSLMLIRDFGINGVAFSAMTSLILWNLLTLAYVRRKFGRSIGYFPLISKRA
jgi:O-antigen/teichoic acid export membrane protein